MLSGTAVSAPSRAPRPAREGRRLVLVDIENLIGGAALDPQTVALGPGSARRRIGLDVTDQVVIGTSHAASSPLAPSGRGQRYVVRSGETAPTWQLLEVLAENLAATVRRGRPRLRRRHLHRRRSPACTAGVIVTSWQQPETLSPRLRLAATHMVFLSDPSSHAIGRRCLMRTP